MCARDGRDGTRDRECRRKKIAVKFKSLTGREHGAEGTADDGGGRRTVPQRKSARHIPSYPSHRRLIANLSMTRRHTALMSYSVGEHDRNTAVVVLEISTRSQLHFRFLYSFFRKTIIYYSNRFKQRVKKILYFFSFFFFFIYVNGFQIDQKFDVFLYHIS